MAWAHLRFGAPQPPTDLASVEVNVKWLALRHNTKLSSPPAQGRWDREDHATKRRCALLASRVELILDAILISGYSLARSNVLKSWQREMEPMQQAMVSGGNLLVAVKSTFALIKVSGKATFKLAPSLKRFCMTAIKQGCQEIIFEMEACQGMDSTFMGVLAGIAIHPPENAEAHVIVMNLTPRTHSMLTTLGLGRVLDCHEQDDSQPELKARLADALDLEGLEQEDDRTLSLTTMLQAHQHLVDVDPENMIRFRDVLTYLDQEVQQDG